ncbi:MAG: VWA domain-containing protein [Planctomycetota bacterium]
MNFAAIAGLWAGLLALPVIALYILKIKRHRREVPYLRLWQDLVADQMFTTLFQRLQRWLSLLLQLLILACLVGALAVLTLSDSFLREDSVVLVVDCGASMNGREKNARDSRSRFEAAVAAAREMVEGRSAEDEMAVVAAGAQPEVLQGFSRSTLRLREACDALRVAPASSDLRAAHRLAKDLLADKKHPRIVLFTDAAGGAAAALADEDPNVRWRRVGETVANVGIVRFQARRNHGLGTDYLLLVVKNFASEPQACRVEIGFEGSTKRVLPLELAADAEFQETIPLTLPEGGFAKAEIVHDKSADGSDGFDGLALDDVAYAAVPTARLYRVLLIAPPDAEAPFKAALAAMGTLVDREGSQAMSLAAFAANAEDTAAKFDLVLVVNQQVESLPSRGCFLSINALPGGLPAKALGVETKPELQEAEANHPLARFLEPKSMRPSAARPLDLSSGTPFLSSKAGPVGVVFQTATRKVVYLGLDVLGDLFFLQVAFPILLRNVFGWVHEQDSELLQPTYRPGEVMRSRFTVADASVEVGWRHEASRQDGKRQVPVAAGSFTFADTGQPGRYWVRTADRDFRTTVNLFDVSESDLRMPEAESTADLDIERAGFLFGRDLWPLLLLVACGLWVLEWALFHRRFTE